MCLLVVTPFANSGENFDITITGVQIEKSTFATSFIPTTTAALTRNKETNKYEIAGNRTAATESCVVKLVIGAANSKPGDRGIIDSDTKRRMAKFQSNDDGIQAYPNFTDSSSSSVVDLINEFWTANTEFTIGFNFQHSSPFVAGFINGVADGTNDTDDDFTNPAWGTYWWLAGDNTGAEQLNGSIAGIARFNRLLSAAEHLFMHEKDWRTLR